MNFITEFDSDSGTILNLDIDFNNEMIFDEKYGDVVIKKINNNACMHGKVTKVNMQNTKIIEIGNNAFAGCSNLKEVKFPDSLVTIGENAFNGCSLKNIRIPKSTQNANGYAFNQQLIECFDVDAENPYFVSERCFWMNHNKTKLIRAPLSFTSDSEIPNFAKLESIGCFALTSTNIRSLTATNNLQILGIYAFHETYNIRRIDLSLSRIEILPSNCFLTCHANEIILPNNIKEIRSSSFKYTNRITKIVLSSTLEVLERESFNKCPRLKEVYYFGQKNFSTTEVINFDKEPKVYVVPGYEYATFSNIHVTQYYPKTNINTCIRCTRQIPFSIFIDIFLFTSM